MPHSSPDHHPHPSASLRAVAILEAAKGLLVLVAGIGIFSFIHPATHDYLLDLASHVHLNPAKNHPQVFLDYLQQLTDHHLGTMTLLASLYVTVRFVEAYGLWHCKRWAEWFAAISGGIYIPFELYEIIAEKSLPTVGILGVNVLIVGLMIRELRRKQTPDA